MKKKKEYSGHQSANSSTIIHELFQGYRDRSRGKNAQTIYQGYTNNRWTAIDKLIQGSRDKLITENFSFIFKFEFKRFRDLFSLFLIYFLRLSFI